MTAEEEKAGHPKIPKLDLTRITKPDDTTATVAPEIEDQSVDEEPEKEIVLEDES